jgi:hypothetical protein
MARPIIDREKEPFIRAPEPIPQPVRFGDLMIDYGHDDPTTSASIKKLTEEEERCGILVTDQPDNANRLKDLSASVQLRRFPPYHQWFVYLNGERLKDLGAFTTIEAAQKAAAPIIAKENN